MKKFLIGLVLIVAFFATTVLSMGVFCATTALAEECDNPSYSMEYATRCIDGNLWMMRVDTIENCVIYLVPVSQVFEVYSDRKGRIVRPTPCTDK